MAVAVQKDDLVAGVGVATPKVQDRLSLVRPEAGIQKVEPPTRPEDHDARDVRILPEILRMVSFDDMEILGKM